MESEFQYRLTKQAEADLDEIVSYIAAELANPQAAADFVARLQKIINETRSFPESGTQVNNEFLPDIGLRKKNVDNYIIYYLPIFEEKTIYIVRIIYGKRNTDEILRNLDL